MDWKLGHTAPRDGRQILVTAGENTHFMVTRYSSSWGGFYPVEKFSLWADIPKPP